MEITFRKLLDNEKEYVQLYNWCQNEFVYEWFEQRKLTLEEIHNKYQDKLETKKQELLIIQYEGIDIGLVQIYKYEDTPLDGLRDYKDIYEFDLFIGKEKYLNQGIGTEVIKEITKWIYTNYDADAIVLRPFKKNERAIHCYEKCGYKFLEEQTGKDTLGNTVEIVVLVNT